jgi:hypothetical protein
MWVALAEIKMLAKALMALKLKGYLIFLLLVP